MDNCFDAGETCLDRRRIGHTAERTRSGTGRVKFSRANSSRTTKTALRESAAMSVENSSKSHRSGLNRRPLDYESSALPLSYCGRVFSVSCCESCCMPWRGLEPRRLAAPPPQDGVSTNFTTRALQSLQLSAICHQKTGISRIAIVFRSIVRSRITVLHGSDVVRTRDLSSDSRVL